jgi:hypothetical protein
VRGSIPLATILLLASIGVPSTPAGAAEVQFSGGMGFAVWPMTVELTDRVHRGVAFTPAGRVRLSIGPHLRLQTNAMMARFSHDDGSWVRRSLMVIGPQAIAPLSERIYLAFGGHLGADSLRLSETVRRTEDDLRVVRDASRWAPVFQPSLAVGALIGTRIELEAEIAEAMVFAGGEVELSFWFGVGVYFRAGVGGRR